MKRRSWLLAGTAVTAAAAGAARRLSSERSVRNPGTAADTVGDQAGGTAGHTAVDTAGGSPDTHSPPALWSLRFVKPDGGELVMAHLRGQPLLLNFWATWCPPCIKEMPDLDQFARQHAARGWRVVGLAVDNPQPVRQFLARNPVSYTIGLAGFEGSELARQLGNTQGALPFTVVFNRDGRKVQQKTGPADATDLQRWAALA